MIMLSRPRRGTWTLSISNDFFVLRRHIIRMAFLEHTFLIVFTQFAGDLILSAADPKIFALFTRIMSGRHLSYPRLNFQFAVWTWLFIWRHSLITQTQCHMLFIIIMYNISNGYADSAFQIAPHIGPWNSQKLKTVTSSLCKKMTCEVEKGGIIMPWTESHNRRVKRQESFKCSGCRNWYPKRLEKCDRYCNIKIPKANDLSRETG